MHTVTEQAEWIFKSGYVTYDNFTFVYMCILDLRKSAHSTLEQPPYIRAAITRPLGPPHSSIQQLSSLLQLDLLSVPVILDGWPCVGGPAVEAGSTDPACRGFP